MKIMIHSSLSVTVFIIMILLPLSIDLWAQNGGSRDGLKKMVDVGNKSVWITEDDAAIVYTSGIEIDADGSPRAYHPKGQGLDLLANAGEPGNWYGIVTDDGTTKGTPIIQKDTDPAPGYYVSCTSLQNLALKRTDPRRYIDSETIPYIAVSSTVMKTKKVRLGDFAVVLNNKNGKHVWAIVGDIGPRKKLGEGSIALAKALGINSNPKRQGAPGGIHYLIFPQSNSDKEMTIDAINKNTERLFSKWGGIDKFKQLIN